MPVYVAMMIGIAVTISCMQTSRFGEGRSLRYLG
jgi:hypothetical protein